MTNNAQSRKPHAVCGIFLERSGGYLLRSMASPVGDQDWHLEYEEDETVSWDANSAVSVEAGLGLLGEIVAGYAQDISSVAIACYGPFLSLTPGASFGVVRDDTADPPLNGLDIYKTFGERLGADWLARGDTRFQVHTDASACAVGEAHLRDMGSDEVLAYLFATDGIGIGLVRGRKIVLSALHPEIGLLPALIHKRDPIAKQTESLPYPIDSRSLIDFQSISQLANNKALKDRYARMKAPNDMGWAFADKKKEELFWDIRACYLAEVCVACTVIHPPHAIVIGANIDPLGDVDKRAWSYVEHFISGWHRHKGPLFAYKELAPGFISRPFSATKNNVPASPAVTGAIGSCYLAAAATVRSKMIGINMAEGIYG